MTKFLLEVVLKKGNGVKDYELVKSLEEINVNNDLGIF